MDLVKQKNSLEFRGLSWEDAAVLLEKHGHNCIKSRKKHSIIKMLISQFKDIMVVLLLLSTLVSILMGEKTEALVIITIVIVNSILGFVQEFRTERSMEALKSLAAPLAKVLRSGSVTEVDAALIVPGDLILLEPGDRVPADSYITLCSMLSVDESLLTGESMPVEKRVKDNISMGTVVMTGNAEAIVRSTGMSTEMGSIAGMLEGASDELTPLQKRLAKMGRIIAAACVVVCAIVSITGMLRGESPVLMLIAGISLAVAAVPEGLPAVVTIALAIGTRRMLKRNALIRRLSSVETLGCADVICSDKTGTLTENKMTVKQIMPEDNNILKAAVLCSNVRIDKDGTKKGDPTEIAFVNAAIANGINIEELMSSNKRIAEIPFDSNKKYMSVVCINTKTGHRTIYTKGAPDVVIGLCEKYQNNKEETSSFRNKLLMDNEKLAASGLRVLGVACSENNKEKEMVFLGLVAMADPPRKEVGGAIRKCKTAGIRTIMITGDHKATALAIAKEIGITGSKGRVLTGYDIDNMDDFKFKKEVEKINVFARVVPKHKLRIVRALRERGHIVAMTGDGVNDAPAIKEADIGVAMGISGTDVTREASSMVLLDDNFATIVAAVEEGRAIYGNIRKFIRYLLSCNTGEVLTMFVSMAAGLPVPLLPIHILWVNLVTDGLPAMALGFDPSDRDSMSHRPRGKNEHVFSGGLAGLILTRGIIIGFSTIASFNLALITGSGLNSARTVAFCTLVFSQLIHSFECRSENKTLFGINPFKNIFLLLAVMLSSASMAMAIYFPPAALIFKTNALKSKEAILIMAFSLLGPVAAAAYKLFCKIIGFLGNKR